MNTPSLSTLSARVTGRSASYFSDDIAAQRVALNQAVADKRILAIGGAGSIGRSTILTILNYAPACIHVVDVNENALADLVRDLRNSGMSTDIEFRALPVDFGSEIMKRYLFEQAPFDAVLNFAALKHVRSEKDEYSLLQMIDTNVVKQARFKRWLSERSGCSRYFAVSTDKAANPTSLMGASKRLMEDVAFDIAADASTIVTSARFANVAFSNGSLLQAFLQRVQQRQPLAAPRDTRRYFVTLEESGHICALAGLLGSAGHVYFPDMEPETSLTLMETVAGLVLKSHGYEPVFLSDEVQAVADLDSLAATGRWPVILTPLNTSGEKPYEEFVGRGETLSASNFKALKCLAHCEGGEPIASVCETFESWVNNADKAVSKVDIVGVIAKAVTNLGHVETGKSLDDRV